MLRKRIIFTLIYNDGYFMQSRNFRLQRVGDIHWLEKNYQFQKIASSLDELIVLNVTRNNRNIHNFSKTITQIRKDVFIPVAAGGGIRSMKDAEVLFQHGADKIVLNSILYSDKDLVTQLVNRYGSQSIIASVDYKMRSRTPIICIENGAREINISLHDYLKSIQLLRVGEIYLNCIDKDGTGFGYDFETVHNINSYLYIPLILAGGAGNEKHLLEGLEITAVNAVATANLFNFVGDGLPTARKKIVGAGFNLANWKMVLDKVYKSEEDACLTKK